jgi:predicted benzoate:H+ symporter BenE
MFVYIFFLLWTSALWGVCVCVCVCVMGLGEYLREKDLYNYSTRTLYALTTASSSPPFHEIIGAYCVPFPVHCMVFSILHLGMLGALLLFFYEQRNAD